MSLFDRVRSRKPSSEQQGDEKRSMWFGGGSVYEHASHRPCSWRHDCQARGSCALVTRTYHQNPWLDDARLEVTWPGVSVLGRLRRSWCVHDEIWLLVASPEARLLTTFFPWKPLR
jgi:hypothetical protein